MVHDVDEASLDFIELRLDRRVQMTAGCLDYQRTGPEGRVGDNLDGVGQAETLGNFSDHHEASGIGSQLLNFTLIEAVESGLDQAGEGFGIDRELAVQDAPRDCNREADQVFFGVLTQLRAGGDHVADHLAQLDELGLKLLFAELASGIIRIAAGRKRLLDAAFGMGLSRVQLGL